MILSWDFGFITPLTLLNPKTFLWSLKNSKTTGKSESLWIVSNLEVSLSILTSPKLIELELNFT